MIGILSKSQSGPTVYLELVGEVDSDIIVQYKRKCDDLRISDKVFFLGRKTREEFRSIQSTWDFYVQAPVCEGMGNSAADSMSNGIPIILSNTEYIAEKASKSFPEIVSPSNNAQDLDKTISLVMSSARIISSTDTRISMMSSSYPQMQIRYSNYGLICWANSIKVRRKISHQEYFWLSYMM